MRRWIVLFLLLSSSVFAESLSVQECQKLYAKQLYLASSAGVFDRALKLNQQALVSATTVQAEVQSCQASVGRPSFECQMKSESFLELLLCRKTIDEGESLERIIENFKNRKTETTSKPPTGQEPAVQTDPGFRAASSEDCKAAYDQMLSVYSDSSYLKSDSRNQSLLEYWQSESARVSFQSRCLQSFKESDAQCLKAAKSPEAVQRCLAVIPPGG